MVTSGQCIECQGKSERAEERNGQQFDGGSQRPDKGIELHVHGSCPKCHHFHRYVPLAVPSDDTEATRFHCERCGHSMFGLGRTSTQDSLASVNSIPVNDGVVDPIEVSRLCSDIGPAQRSLSLDTSTQIASAHLLHEPLSAITERSSPAERSRSTSDARGLPTDILQDDNPNSSERVVDQGPCFEGKAHTPRFTRRYRWRRRCSLLDFKYRLLKRVAQRICGKPTVFRILGFCVSVQITSRYLEDTQTLEAYSASIPNESTTSPALNVEAAHDYGSHAQRSKHSGELVGEPSTTQSINMFIERPHALPDNDGNLLDNNVIMSNDSLRIRRREKTLQREAMLLRCTCTDDCHCRTKDGDISDSRSNGHMAIPQVAQGETSDSDPPTASQPGNFGGLTGRETTRHPSHSDVRSYLYAQMGAIFRTRRRMSSTYNSSSTDGNTQQRRRSGLGLTSSSTGSSISLYPQRPTLPGRSLSASALPTSNEVAEVADVLGHVHTLHQDRPAHLPWHLDGLNATAGLPASLGQSNDGRNTNDLSSNLMSSISPQLSPDHADGHLQAVGTLNEGDEDTRATPEISEHTTVKSTSSASIRSTNREVEVQTEATSIE